MIRPELIAGARRWAEPLLAAGGTLAALWIVGAGNLRWGWLTIGLSAVILLAGGLWVRESIRRIRFSMGVVSGGRVYVEERRILYIGALGNVQIDLDDVWRVDLAVSKPNGQRWASVLLHADGPPAAIPLNAEGEDALLDALCALPGFRLDDLTAAIAKMKGLGGGSPIHTFWRRTP